MYVFHKYNNFSVHVLLYTGALDGILLKIYAVDLKKNSYKTNLTENIQVVFMG
jgi:hypothetical protein